jgi:hypothetical protein
VEVSFKAAHKEDKCKHGWSVARVVASHTKQKKIATPCSNNKFSTSTMNQIKTKEDCYSCSNNN